MHFLMLSMETFVLKIHSDLLCPELTSAHFILKSKSVFNTNYRVSEHEWTCGSFLCLNMHFFPPFLIVKVRSSKADTRMSNLDCSRCPGEQWAWPHVLCCLQRLRRALSCSWRWSLLVQVFVANPNKTQPILDILLKNQAKLIEFLSKFQNDRTEDEQFNDEKTYLVKQIRDLKRPAQQEAWFPINTENIKSKFSVCCSLFSIRHCYRFMRNITANLLLSERFSFYLFWFFFVCFFSPSWRT